MTPADPVWLERIDHTADEGVIVRAENQPDLFSRAAWAMFSVIADLSTVRAVDSLPVSVQAPDCEALMVRWLSELNVLHETRGMLFRDFRVNTVTDTHLVADIQGEVIDQDKHDLYTEIKAVTYHGLSVRKEGGMWVARVLFDV